MEDAEKILSETAKLCRLDFLWKGIGGCRAACGFSPEHTLHCSRFCREVKKNKTRLERCIRNDNQLLVEKIGTVRAPFLHRCHAGVSEIVVPLFNGKQELEVVLLGIFREENAHCPYRSLELLYRQLPLKKGCAVAAAMEIFPPLCRILLERREQKNLQDLGTRISDSRIRQSLVYLERNMMNPVSAGQMASEVFLSKSRFLHLFKAETGYSWQEYLLRKRMEKAAGLLRDTDLSISSVMEKCGMRDQSHFGMMFRRCSGYSPLVYRKKFRAKRNA